jgi:hypothetical protein
LMVDSISKEDAKRGMLHSALDTAGISVHCR